MNWKFWQKQPRVIVSPKGKVLKRFVCVEDFYSKETRSQYLSGMTYYVREGNDLLDGLVQKWARQNKVRIL